MLNKFYLAIFGGRNDDEFNTERRNCALNDLVMFDISKIILLPIVGNNAWISVGSLGHYPMSRYSHSMCVIKAPHGNSKLVVFGGENMKSYCPNFLSVFETDGGKVEAY